jgi:hypothetical protein
MNITAAAGDFSGDRRFHFFAIRRPAPIFNNEISAPDLISHPPTAVLGLPAAP